MTMIRTPAEIFADADMMHGEALERLEAGDIRDAAEKAWRSARRATDALILARTGAEPEVTPQTSRELRRLGSQDSGVAPMVNVYFAIQNILHGDCFYLGLCEPLDDTRRRIRETGGYLRDARRQAGM